MKVIANPPPICPSFFLVNANWILSNRHPSRTKQLVLPDHVCSGLLAFIFDLCGIVWVGYNLRAGITPKQWPHINRELIVESLARSLVDRPLLA
jgi:hypothetical protein